MDPSTASVVTEVVAECATHSDAIVTIAEIAAGAFVAYLFFR